VLQGLRLLSSWSARIQEAHAWKLTHPCTDPVVAVAKQPAVSAKGAKSPPPQPAALPAVERPGAQYEAAVRRNYSKDELSALVRLVAAIKSLGALLAKAEPLYAPFVRLHVHHAVQQLVQGTLKPPLHRAHKRKRPMKAQLLELRRLAADWAASTEPEPATDYEVHGWHQSFVRSLV
jgi:cytoplasmic FMR1 interacting protein